MDGRIVHVELPASDTGRAKEFYSGLFGWTFRDAGMPGVDYHMFAAEPAGAVFRSEDAGTGPRVYYETDDIDAATASVRALGGTAEAKHEIPGVGWSASCKDLDGNPFSFFQAGDAAAQAS